MVNQIGKPYPEKIAVIGGGPAGLSCAYYLAVKGYPVTVFEKEQALGGMLTLGIPAFRLEKSVINAEIDVLRELGVTFRTGVEVGKDLTLDTLRQEGFKAFYLAVGASKGAKLDIPGEELEGVSSGVYYRRGEAEMPADRDELAEAKEEGVAFRFLAAPAEILGEGRAQSLKLERMEAGEPDEKGRRSVTGTGEFETVPADAVLSATGQRIDLCGMDFAWTSVPDVFAGGDVVTGPKFVIDAIAAGKEAAVSIHRFVHPGQTLDLGRDRRDYRPFDRTSAQIGVAGFDSAPRQHPAGGDAAAAKSTFNDLRGTFTEEQMKTECARCLGCGTAVVDSFMCVGCGVCTTKCKFDAIHLEKIHDADNQEYFRTLGRVAKNVPGIGVNIVKKHFGKLGGRDA